MIFSRTTTMAAAALLAVLFLGSSTHAAPIDPPTGGLVDDVGYALGYHVGGAVDTLVPDLVEGGLDGAQPNELPLYDTSRAPVPAALYTVGKAGGKTYATVVPGSTVQSTIDGVSDATGKE
ncbi:MAG: hypothetical protein J3R72DRAFT_435351 [Linnemannia gamsii]|nr:MAG: hypothetical protein J3R72DRAFT_435351 [Linnemannia gamsii]